MLYKAISPKVIIAKAQMSFQLQGNNWQGWALEWIGDALRAIGNSAGTTTKRVKIPIKNHKGELPCDLLELLAVEYLGFRLKLGGNTRTGEYNYSLNRNNSFSSEYPLDKNVGNDKVDDELQKIYRLNYLDSDYYLLTELDYIETSFECGELTLFYTAYKTDEEGYPMVPDTFQHSEALQYFILFKLCSGGYKHPVWDVKSAMDMWNDFKRKASNKTSYPSIDSMERFRNMWCRQVADVFAPDKFFSDSQNIQTIYGI